MNQRRTRISAALFVLGAAAGCSDNTSPSEVAGSYTAIVFMTSGSSGQTNHLVAGSTFNITLNSNGTTSGHLHVAASGGDPGLDADMAGTWSQNGDVVDFTQAADTFVRDMAFRIERVGPNVLYLVGDQTFSGTNISVTLARES